MKKHYSNTDNPVDFPGSDIHAGEGGYSEGTQEKYEEFVKVRNQSLAKMRAKMRIRELALQANLEFDGDMALEPEPIYYITQRELEMFAVLIVKEYEKLLPETCPWADADKEGPMKGWHVQFVARKHFGVEE